MANRPTKHNTKTFNTTEIMIKIDLIGIVLIFILGFLLGRLRERWLYYKKTGKHLQNLKNKKHNTCTIEK